MLSTLEKWSAILKVDNTEQMPFSLVFQDNWTTLKRTNGRYHAPFAGRSPLIKKEKKTQIDPSRTHKMRRPYTYVAFARSSRRYNDISITNVILGLDVILRSTENGLDLTLQLHLSGRMPRISFDCNEWIHRTITPEFHYVLYRTIDSRPRNK